MMIDETRFQVAIVGGCGHVGLPLGLALALRGVSVVAYDVDLNAVDMVNAGKMPFLEDGADQALEQVRGSTFRASADPSVVADVDIVIVVIGTPVDQYLNPDPEAIPEALDPIVQYLSDGQLVVLRSTVYPGVTASLERRLANLGLEVDIAFCPERIAEGHALIELTQLPQIVAGRTERAQQRAASLFRVLTDEIVFLDPEEAELAKLFTNTWRYIRFAIANQLFMIANDYGLDYERIRSAIRHEYPRAADLPGAGFAAGPCLLKDTAQLAAFNDNNFTLGHAATLVNEGLPNYLVTKLCASHDLANLTVGILGMAFKAESDDMRSSLSYKLKRILRFRAGRVLCTDPYVSRDPDLQPLEQVLTESDLLIIGAPHQIYAEIETDKPIVDIWNLRKQGVLL
jgi:UDP-N-acetyl-D-mannosaminuronic acid dehydrogenase